MGNIELGIYSSCFKEVIVGKTKCDLINCINFFRFSGIYDCKLVFKEVMSNDMLVLYGKGRLGGW